MKKNFISHKFLSYKAIPEASKFSEFKLIKYVGKTTESYQSHLGSFMFLNILLCEDDNPITSLYFVNNKKVRY